MEKVSNLSYKNATFLGNLSLKVEILWYKIFLFSQIDPDCLKKFSLKMSLNLKKPVLIIGGLFIVQLLLELNDYFSTLAQQDHVSTMAINSMRFPSWHLWLLTK